MISYAAIAQALNARSLRIHTLHERPLFAAVFISVKLFLHTRILIRVDFFYMCTILFAPVKQHACKNIFVTHVKIVMKSKRDQKFIVQKIMFVALILKMEIKVRGIHLCL